MLPSLFAPRWVERQTLMTDDGLDIKLFILVGWGQSFLSVAWPTGLIGVFPLIRVSVSYIAPRDLHRLTAN